MREVLEFHAMCMVVYVGSDQPLPRQPWDEAAPAFCVTDIPECDAEVTRHFSKPHVCYVGSHEGCGCGFQSSEFPEDDDPDDLAVARQQRAHLARLLRVALEQSTTLELYACWSGDESKDVEYRGVVVPEDLLSARERFRERELLTVVRARPLH